VNTNVAQKQQKEQDWTPQEQFTGKNLTRFDGVGLLRRFFEKRKLRKQLETVSLRGQRNSDYSPAQMCKGMLYALMLGIFRPSHMMERELWRTTSKSCVRPANKICRTHLSLSARRAATIRTHCSRSTVGGGS
jgi:hypothetical protein